MAIIGHFTKQENGGFDGTIETLAISSKATFELLTRRGDKSPDFRIVTGRSEIGAAWKRTSENSEHFSVRLDDPSFAAPINCRLVKTGVEHGYSLIWERERKRS
jgi:uncharacterized protein (DUF736 family)